MGMLDAFLRGAAGQGLVDLSRSMGQREAEERAAKTRQQALEEERAWREAEAEKDRVARYGSARIRAGGGGEAGEGGGGGGGDNYAVAELMKREGISEGEARALIQSGREGKNPLVKAVNDESGGHSAPDAERWARVNRAIARALETADAKSRSNFDQLTQGEGNEQRNAITGGMLAGKLTPEQTAQAVAATKGEGGYKNARTNEFTGVPTAIGKSEIAENNAQAGSAGRANRDALDGLKLPAVVKDAIANFNAREKEIASAITKAQAEDTWNPAASPGQKALQAELAAVRLKRQQLIAPYLPKANGGNADPLGLMGDDKSVKPSQSDVRKAEPKEPSKQGDSKSPMRLETTMSNEGKQLFRYEGQKRWYPSKEQALADLGRDKADGDAATRRGMLTLGQVF